MASVFRRVGDWFDERTSYRALIAHALDEPVPGGASYAYVFGSVLTFVLALQAVTGVLLAMYYSPSATDAWASVAYIEDQVTMGWFIRGLHSHGASAMVILSGLHLMQTALYGAYKKPRELNWLVGVLMLGLVLAFALTGYLLPWDQTGYWATKVATGIAGTSPMVGQQLQELAQAGNEYGNLTLTRFFAIHVFILPALIVGLVVLHVALFRKHGVTPKWNKGPAQLKRDTQPFWPDQLFKDMVAVAVVFAALVIFNLYNGGVGLQAPADPSSNFDARPEWYFRSLFQALKYFEGPLETLVALGLPVVVGGVLLGLPFVDRSDRRAPRDRAPFLAVLGLGIAGAIALTIVSYADDAADADLQVRLAKAKADANVARTLARQNGVPAAGGTAVYTTAEHYQAKVLWKSYCRHCHDSDADRSQAGVGPIIEAGYNSRNWIAAFYRAPSDAAFFGLTGINGMKPVKQTGREFDALVEFVYGQSGASDVNAKLAAEGETLFDDGNCSNCHSADWETEDEPGPNVGKRGTRQMFEAFIAQPAHPRWFGDSNEMPAFEDELSSTEIRALADYLVYLRDQPPPQGRSAGKNND